MTKKKKNKPARLNVSLATVYFSDFEFEFFCSFALSVTTPAARGAAVSVCTELGNASNIPSAKLTRLILCMGSVAHKGSLYPFKYNR
jgi:hypothetical protein